MSGLTGNWTADKWLISEFRMQASHWLCRTSYEISLAEQRFGWPELTADGYSLEASVRSGSQEKSVYEVYLGIKIQESLFTWVIHLIFSSVNILLLTWYSLYFEWFFMQLLYSFSLKDRKMCSFSTKCLT